MKKSIIIIAAIFMTAFTTNVMAQATVTPTSAAVKIIAPIGLTETSSFDFGTMSVLAGSLGTCTLSTANARSFTGGVNLSSSTTKNAAYGVTGNKSTTYIITLPSSITVTNGTATEDMIINALLAKCASNNGNGLVGTIDASTGTDSFTVGGTLNVAAAQPAATYTGTFPVTVAYN